MRLRCAASFALTFAACGPSTSPSPVTPATTSAASDASPSATSVTANATSSYATTASSPDAPPPSGFYRYALHVVSDDCTPALQSFEQKGMMVFAHTTSKGVVLNVPLVVMSGSAVARSDVEATPGATRKHVTKTAACATADVRHTLVTKTVSRTLVVLEETTEHLDASTCTPPGPPACTTRVEIRLALEEAKCEATCAATANMTKTPPQFVCKCP